MNVRIEFPFYANFELPDLGNNSRELRTQHLQTYLRNSGMELGGEVERFVVTSFNGEDNGEFWRVSLAR
jgi:hypothetical protein